MCRGSSKRACSAVLTRYYFPQKAINSRRPLLVGLARPCVYGVIATDWLVGSHAVCGGFHALWWLRAQPSLLSYLSRTALTTYISPEDLNGRSQFASFPKKCETQMV